MSNQELNGAWEERGVIGTRAEIDGDRIVVLWRVVPDHSIIIIRSSSNG